MHVSSTLVKLSSSNLNFLYLILASYNLLPVDTLIAAMTVPAESTIWYLTFVYGCLWPLFSLTFNITLASLRCLLAVHLASHAFANLQTPGSRRYLLHHRRNSHLA